MTESEWNSTVQYIALCIATDTIGVDRGVYHGSEDGGNAGKGTNVTHGIVTRRDMSERET